MDGELIVTGPEILVPKKNVIFDATVLTALMNCARFANLRFNHNLVSIGGKSNSLECGSIVHKYLEIYYKSRIGGLKQSDAHAMGYAAAQLYIAGCQYCTDFKPEGEIKKPYCGHPPNEYPGVKNTPIEPSPDKPYQIGWRWVLETCEQYYEFWKNDSWVPLEVEVVKSKVLYEDDTLRVLWKAKHDWIVDMDKGIHSIDHKSMKQNRSQTKLNNQFIGQNLIMGTRTVYLNKVGFQKTLPPEKRFIRAGVSYSADQLLEWQSEILPYYANILLAYTSMEYYPPNFTNCQGKFGDCIFMEVCESDRNMREEMLRRDFVVGPDWDPSNEGNEGDD